MRSGSLSVVTPDQVGRLDGALLVKLCGACYSQRHDKQVSHWLE